MKNELPSAQRPLRIGTRGSPLALAQAHETRRRLSAAFGLPDDAFEIHAITTAGDRIQDRPLKDLGGKGLFTREIENELLIGGIDIAVHSMKDMPVDQPQGLVLECYLPREDARDALIAATAGSLDDLPAGAVIGTSSLRRRAQILHLRPDLRPVEFRGNVQTRLRKLDEGQAQATMLAVAGLNRLDLAGAVPHAPIPVEVMLPAVAQGAIGIERRREDLRTGALLAAIHHAPTGLQLAAERAFLAALDGSCQTPIAGHAVLEGDGLRLRGQILNSDGSRAETGEVTGPANEGAALGRRLAATLLDRAGPGFFDWR